MKAARRSLAAAALGLVVLLLHLWGSDRWLVRMAEAAHAGAPAIRRIDVAFVRDLLPTALPAAPSGPARQAPSPPGQRVARSARLPASAASSVEPPRAEEPSDVAPPARTEPASAAASPADLALADATPTPVEQTLRAAAAAAAEPSASAESEPATPAFEWPPSTRLSYILQGQYRGEVQGRATVEWLREGLRYQVHLQALVGLSALPLMARRLSSEGQLTPQGLAPQRMTGEQRIGLNTRRWQLSFNTEVATLADGRQRPAAEGLQDEASQFVQLAWLFTTQPQRLVVGQSVSFPLALPRRLDRWVYDVVGEDTLAMPFGDLKAMHLKPRRDGQPGELTAQIWIAPTLQYLPVRILIHQDAQTYIDLMLERAPEQALR